MVEEQVGILIIDKAVISNWAQKKAMAILDDFHHGVIQQFNNTLPAFKDDQTYIPTEEVRNQFRANTERFVEGLRLLAATTDAAIAIIDKRLNS